MAATKTEYTGYGWNDMKNQTSEDSLESSSQVRIVDLNMGDDATAFKNLNEEWIAKYFTLEERDREILGNPDEYVLNRGGRVFMLYIGDAAVGCAALVPMGDGVYELSKMSVRPDRRGLGLGRKLIEHTIAEATSMGAERLFLGSNTKLENAVRLYESVGFAHLPPDKVPKLGYARANVFMELELRPRSQGLGKAFRGSPAREVGETQGAESLGRDRFVARLLASGPCEVIPESENFYGRLVGSWTLNVLFYRRDLRRSETRGQVHFAWVLEGRAIQDVWEITPDTGGTESVPTSVHMCGTTLRVWNTELGKWQITWINAVTGACDRLEAQSSGNEIVQTGHHLGGTPIRWVFSEMTDNTFHWTGDTLEPDGVTWKRDAEFLATRIHS